MELWEVADILGYKEWRLAPQRLRLLDLFRLEKTETEQIKGPLGVWPFPALNTFLYNVRLLTKVIKR
ncbi:MAG: hypothetical protein QW660_07955 [Candidatus Bathyarchaeia archaeon]